MSYEKGLDSYVNVQGEEWFDPCPYACNSCDHLILIGVVEECWNLESLVCQLGVVFVEFLEKRFDNPSCWVWDLVFLLVFSVSHLLHHSLPASTVVTASVS